MVSTPTIWILSMFLQVSLCFLGGDFTVNIESLDNRKDLSREYADWHIMYKRVNKTQKFVEGYIKVKKPVVSPKIYLEAYVLSSNKFHRLAINGLSPIDLCDKKVIKDFYDPIFTGNISWTSGCSITPGYVTIVKDQNNNVDYVVHKKVNKVIYGTYKVVMIIVNDQKKTVGGVTAVLSVKKKTE